MNRSRQIRGRDSPAAAETPGSPLNVPPALASTSSSGGDCAYARDDGTPTWEAFEKILGGLEHGVAVAFASGMAAAAAIFDLLPARAQVVLPDDCYQAVVGLAAAGQERGRWSYIRLPLEDTGGWLEAAEHAGLLWLESPSNPLLHVADLPTILASPSKHRAIAVVDSASAARTSKTSGPTSTTPSPEAGPPQLAEATVHGFSPAPCATHVRPSSVRLPG